MREEETSVCLCNLPFGQIALPCIAKRLQISLEAARTKIKLKDLENMLIWPFLTGNSAVLNESTLQHFVLNSKAKQISVKGSKHATNYTAQY